MSKLEQRVLYMTQNFNKTGHNYSVSTRNKILAALRLIEAGVLVEVSRKQFPGKQRPYWLELKLA